jgi:hypothetical protein
MEIQIKQTERELRDYEDTCDKINEKTKKNQGIIME